MMLGELERAITAYEKAIEEIGHARAADPDDVQLRVGLVSLELGLGQVLTRAEQYERSENLHRAALRTLDGLVEADAGNVHLRTRRAVACLQLGDVLRATEEWAGARDLYRRCRDDVTALHETGRLAGAFERLLTDAGARLAECEAAIQGR